MNEHKCPECSKPMILVRVIRGLNDSPPLGVFYCRPCEFADTVAVVDAPAVALGGERSDNKLVDPPWRGGT